MVIPEGGEQTSGDKVAKKPRPSPKGRGAKEHGDEANVGRGKVPGAGGKAPISGVGGSKRKRTSGLVSLSEIHKDELMAVAGEHWARGAAMATSKEAASTRGRFKSKLVSVFSVPSTPSNKNICRYNLLTFC